MSVKEAKEAAHSGDESAGEEHKVTEHFYNAPQFLSPVIRRNYLLHMIKSLPPKSQKAVKALKNIQLEQLKMEVKFYEEVYELQKKYQALYNPLHEKRRQIVTGEHEPTDTEADWKSEAEDEEYKEAMKMFSDDIKKMTFDFPKDAKGIPFFWYQIFRNSEILSEMIQEHDVELLKKLSDVRLVYKEDDPMSYVVEFHFEPNEYFTNTVLTKQYFMRTTLNPDDPFVFEGPEIYKCTGCTINWNKGKNLTVKTIKKKQKHKARNAVRTVTKQVETESFFHFFNPPVVPDDISKVDVESQQILTLDFEIGHTIRERIIPKAVLYYTGEVIDDDDDMDEEEEEEEQEEEEDELDDEDDADEAPAPHAGKHKQKRGGGGGGGVPKGGNPAECPQQ